jgi:hypothetical protein
MALETNTVRETAREFAVRVADGDPPAAADLLSDDGREAVVDAYPDDLGNVSDAEDALEQFWYGLYGEYGDFEGVETLAVEAPCALAELGFADGTQTLELGVEDGAVVAFSLPTAHEPPAYADLDAFDEREVTVDAGDVALDGVLAVPNGDGPFPGVVLVHGAGIHDPDGGLSNVLKDLAWGLATEGVAVLRYAKRLRDHDVPAEEYTLDNVVVDDAVAAVDELAATDAVSEDSVFVAGHSQGGTAAPQIADRHGGVAGIANLDGAVQQVSDPETPFLQYEFEPDGDLSDEQEAELAALREQLRRVADGDYDPDEEVVGRPGRWHDSLREYDAGATAEALDAPAFVATSGRADPDVQPGLVTFHEQRYAEWNSLDLPEGSRVERYPEVGHYFRDAHEPTTMAHLYFADNVAGEVVADLAAWVESVADA